MDMYQLIFENVADALIVVDPNGRITNVNAQAETLFGYTRNELIGSQIELLIPERLGSAHVILRETFFTEPTVRRMGSRRLEMLTRKKSGSEFAVDIMISPLHTESTMYALCAIRDSTDHIATLDRLRHHNAEMATVHDRLRYLASHDGQTELLNRCAFQEQVEWLLNNASRRGGSISLLMIDLDYFKSVNDEFGHILGDRLLCAVARALRVTCRANDLAARYGGEEFIVALPDTDATGSMVAAENFRAAIANIHGCCTSVTASIGAVTYLPLKTSAAMPLLYESLVNDADRALYAAKKAGRNCVRHVDMLTDEKVG